MRCERYYKDTKNESNSQLKLAPPLIYHRCERYYKDTKNESNSQHQPDDAGRITVVNDITKIQKMKAIHNLKRSVVIPIQVVNDITKIQKMKAIHNDPALLLSEVGVVNDITKIQKNSTIGITRKNSYLCSEA